MTPPRPILTPRNSRRPRLGLTPLIDVVFILLVFFMLASRLEDRRAIPLSAEAEGGGAPGLVGAVLVELRPEGLRLGGAPVTPQALGDRLSARLRERPDQRILIRPASGASMQRLATLLDRLDALGARHVALLAGAR
ncbi:MAG: biopolymer transporter ExbD [Pseudomonadota bacterium]